VSDTDTDTRATRTPIIDAHNHVWPDKVAARALGGSVPDMDVFGDGTVAGLRRAKQEAGIDLSVCLAVANTAAQVESAKRFLGGLDREDFIPFGTIHPDLPPEENLAHLRANRVEGVKLHPVFQKFRLDDPKLYDVLGALAGEFPAIIHVGAGGGGDGSTCTPAMLRDIVLAFPDLDVIACHFGGYHMLEAAEASVIGLPVMLDTAWPPSLAALDPSEVRDLIRRHGVERVVFSSDWPTASPGAEVEAIRALGLDDDETAAVLGGNIARVLGR
jgi:predicted TIM-barrel fold metal-dependent hydrolase